jgi:hypothetical protein
MKKSIITLFLLILIPSVIFAQKTDVASFDSGSWGEEFGSDDQDKESGIYGYIVNYFNANLYQKDNRIDDSDFGNILYSRFKGDFKPEKNLFFHIEAAYQNHVGNMNPYVIYDSLGLNMIDQMQFPLEDFNQTLFIDHIWGSVSFRKLDLQFGKIPIAWGTGYVFNPSAKASFVPFLETITEETPGTLGVIPSISIINELSLQGYVAFQDRSHKNTALKEDADWSNIPFGIKLKAFIGSFDVSLGWIREVIYNETAMPLQDPYFKYYYASLDFAGGIWDIGLYGEACVNIPRNEDDTKFELKGHDPSELLDACFGFDYEIPFINTELRMEYYHQGRGRTDKKNYDIMKQLSGMLLVQAEDYLFAYLSKTFLNYYKIAFGSLINLNDMSYGLLPEINADLYNNFQLSIGSYIFYGKPGTEFNGEYELYGIGTIDVTDTSVYLRCKLSF